MPVAPLLIDADEVATDTIDHAVRFLLPNTRIRDGVWVAPASTEAFGPSGAPDAPPRGARFRLRADYDLDSLPNDGARAVAHALQTYGMVLSDTSNIPLTARSDRGTSTSWSGLLGATDLADILVADFEMVAAGTRYPQGDCMRQGPIPETPGETSGAFASPLLVTDYDSSTGELSIAYDSACSATDNNIYFGPLDALSTYGYTGEVCGIGTGGNYDEFAPGASSYFFLVVGSRNDDEGSYGLSRQVGGAQTQRPPYVSNGCDLVQTFEDSCDE
jgi:hypothetical protein